MAKKATTKKSTSKSARISKKSSTKNFTKTSAQVQAHAVKTSRSATSEQAIPLQSKLKSLKIRKSYVILIIVMFALGAFLYYSRGLFVAAIVNGQPISRVSIIKETEKQSGKQALDTVVRNTLIEQEARKQNAVVTEKEIDDEIKKVEDTLSKQGQKLNDVLAMQGMTSEDLRRLIRLDKLVGKIVGKDIKVSDKEIAEYIEKNKEVLPQDQTEDQLKKTAGERIRQDKLNEKVQTWLESLKNKAKILYFVQY